MVCRVRARSQATTENVILVLSNPKLRRKRLSRTAKAHVDVNDNVGADTDDDGGHASVF